VGSLVGKLCGVGLGVLLLSGCVAGDGADDRGPTAGAIELAVSETCVADSAPQCVAVNGEHVMVDAAGFSRAEVESVAVADDQQGNAVEVTLSSDGATVLETATAEVAQAGDDARLVIKVGDEVLSAVAVAEALKSDHFLMALPSGTSAEEFIEKVERA